MQIILALVVVSFVFWYSAPQGDQATVIATVNGDVIMDTEFFRRYRQAEQRQGRAMQDTERAQLREQVKQQLIEEQVILQEAKNLGLVVSDREIARELLTIARFQNIDSKVTVTDSSMSAAGSESARSMFDAKQTDLERCYQSGGKSGVLEVTHQFAMGGMLSATVGENSLGKDPRFGACVQATIFNWGWNDPALDGDVTVRFERRSRFDRDLYTRTLRSMGYTQSVFEDIMRKDLLRAKLQRLVFMGTSISEPVLREAFIQKETRVDISYVRVRPPVFIETVEITDEERTTYKTENEPEITARYQQDMTRLYDLPHKVMLSVLRLEKKDDGEDIDARIAAIKAELEGGADFDDLARRYSEDPSASAGGNLGMLAVSSLSLDVQTVLKDSSGVDLPDGAVTLPVSTDTDVRLFQVVEREEGRVVPLEEVQDSIIDRLIGEEKAPVAAAAFAEETLAAWQSAGSVPTAVVEGQRLQVSQTGPIPLGGTEGPFAPPPAMMLDAKHLGVGDVLPTVYEASDIFWIGQITEIQPADMDLYEIERDQIREEVLLERRVDFYKAWIAERVASASIQ